MYLWYKTVASHHSSFKYIFKILTYKGFFFLKNDAFTVCISAVQQSSITAEQMATVKQRLYGKQG